MQEDNQEITMKIVDGFLTSLGYVEDYNERVEGVEENDDGEEIVVSEERVYKRDRVYVNIERNESDFSFNVSPDLDVFDFSREEDGRRKNYKINSLKSFKEVIIILSNTDCFSKKFNRLEDRILSIDGINKVSEYYSYSYKIGNKFEFTIWPRMLNDQCFVKFDIWDLTMREPRFSGFSFLFHIDDNNKINEIISCLKNVSETMDMSHIKSL